MYFKNFPQLHAVIMHHRTAQQAHAGAPHPPEALHTAHHHTHPPTTRSAIGQQFLRRERALTMLGELKASVIAIYWAHRDWAQGPTYPATLGDDNSTWAREVANVLMDFLDSAQKYIHCNGG
jgi:hypothetical protein